MDNTTNSNDLVNYENRSSNSINYSSFQSTSCPESFPQIMGNGILVKYEYLEFSTELIEESEIIEE